MIKLVQETQVLTDRSANELNLSHSSSSASILIPLLVKNQPPPSSNNCLNEQKPLLYNIQSPEPTHKGQKCSNSSFPEMTSSSFLYPSKANNVYTNNHSSSNNNYNNNNNIHTNLVAQTQGDRVNSFNKENSTAIYHADFPASNDNIHRNYLTPPANRSLVGAESLTPISQQNISHNSSYAGNLLLERPDRTVIYKDLNYLQEMLASEREKNEALNTKLQSLQNEITDMMLERNGMKKKNECLQQEIEKLKDQIARESNSKHNDSNLRSALEYLQRERDSLEKEKKDLLNKHKMDMDLKAVELANLRKIIDAYQTNSFPKKEDPVIIENQKLTKEVEMIRGVLKDYEELEGSCEDLIRENERMNMILIQKSNEVEALKAKQQKPSLLNITNQSNNTSSNFLPVELEKKITELIDENCLLNSEKQAIQKDLFLIQEKLKKLVDVNEKLNQIVEEQERSVRALTKKNCELEEEIVSFKRHVNIVTTAFEARVKDMEVEKDEQKRRNEELMMEKDKHLQSFEGGKEAEETIKDLKRKLVTMIEENDKLNQVLINKLEETEMIKKVEAKMETLIKENQSLRTDIINKNYEVEYWQKRVVDSKI